MPGRRKKKREIFRKIFWEQNWKELFGVKNEGDEPKFSLSTKQPKADGIRYALLVYENLHRGDNWKIAQWIAKREEQKRGAGVGGSFFYAREDVDSDFHRNECLSILIKLESILDKDGWIFSHNINKLDIAILPFIRQFKIADPEWFENQIDILKVNKLLNKFLNSDLFKNIMFK